MNQNLTIDPRDWAAHYQSALQTVLHVQRLRALQDDSPRTRDRIARNEDILRAIVADPDWPERFDLAPIREAVS